MADSFVTGTFTGASSIINIPFGYLDKTHVKVYLNGVLKVVTTDYVWNSDSQIQILGGNPANGTVYLAQRNTPRVLMAEFQPGNLDTTDLNFSFLQAIYVAVEAIDAVAQKWGTLEGTIGKTIQSLGTTLNHVPVYDASGNLIMSAITVDDFQNINDNVASALASKNAAAISETNAATSATLAGKWASNPEDVEVIPSSGLFSAFHWYRKTLALYNAVANTLAGWIHAATAKTPMVDADEFGYWDSVSGLLRKLTLANLVASIFISTRKITSANFVDDMTLWATGGLTKGMKFDLSLVTAGQTRVVRVPDAADLALDKWEHIQTVTVANGVAIIDFTGLANYKKLRLTGWVSASGATGGMQFRTSANNGSSYDAGASDYTQQVITASATSVTAGNNTSTSMQISASAGVTRMALNALIESFNQATRTTVQIHCYGADNGGVVVETVIGGERNANTAHNAFRILLAVGTFTGGELKIEGVR